MISGDEVNLELDIEDESSISKIYVYFEHEISKVTKNFVLDAEEKETGIYNYSFVISNNMSDGKWQTSWVTLEDEYGNTETYRNYKEIHFYIEDNVLDITPPELLNLTIEEQGKTLNAGNTISIELDIEDESSISKIYVYFEHEISKVTKNFVFDAKEKETGIYDYSFMISKEMNDGKWQTSWVTLEDEYGNSKTYRNYKEVHFFMAAGTEMLDAIEAVERAEKSKLKTDISSAEKLVMLLDKSRDKTSLLDRLESLKQNVDFIIEASEEIILSFNTTNTPEVKWSIDDESVAKITKTGGTSFSMPGFSRESHSATILGLKSGRVTLVARRVNGTLINSTVIVVVNNYEESLSETEALVAKAEDNLLKVDYDLAQDKVSNLNRSVEKTEFQNRLNALKISVELSEAKTSAENELDEYIDQEKYTVNADLLIKALKDGKASIKSSKTVEKVNESLSKAKDIIDGIESDEQILTRELITIKSDAKSELETYVDVKEYKINAVLLEETIRDGKLGINESVDAQEVKRVLKNVKSKIDKIKSDVKMIETTRENALLEFEDYADSTKYTINSENFLKVFNEGENAISKSVDIESINHALSAAKAAIDEIKTDAEIADVENAVATAEKSKLISDFETAENKVKALPNSLLKTSLLKRLENVESQIKVGWFKDKRIWYYFDNDGAMQRGWAEIDNSWYYMAQDGAMQTGWTKVGSSWYYLSGSGTMQTGWTKVGSSWYYLSGSGSMQTGWLKLGSSWYYLKSNGSMQTGHTRINNKPYYFDSSGRMK